MRSSFLDFPDNTTPSLTMISRLSRHLWTCLLIILLCSIQGQIWFGHGSVSHIRQEQQLLQQKQEANTQMQAQLARLQAEVHDLKEGTVMVEGRARMELGMVKPNELFVQVVQ